MNTALYFGLKLAGLPDDLIADIDKALPAAQRLVETGIHLTPEFKAAEPDLNIVIPVASKLLAFLNQKGVSPPSAK